MVHKLELVTALDDIRFKTGRINTFDPNEYLARMHYANGGIHLNERGKHVLAKALTEEAKKLNAQQEEDF